MPRPLPTYCPVAALIACLSIPGLAVADVGDPIAIRHLPGGGFSVETMWNFDVVFHGTQPIDSQIDGIDVLPADSGLKIAEPKGRIAVRIGSDSLAGKGIVFDRLPNQPHGSIIESSVKPSTNAIRVQQQDGYLLIAVDGVRITMPTGDAKGHGGGSLPKCDVLIAGSFETNEAAKKVVATYAESGATFLVVAGALMGDDATGPNTVAVRAGENADAEHRAVVLSDLGPAFPEEFATLLADKEKACRSSQRVFAKLSVDQMNFRPSNGSHTPRWNSEHMMGRELLFFSQMFAEQDATFRPLDLNPQQMPPDYVARHADWTGEEEARQMERVSAFTRRFAYLIAELPLDQRAPGSRWTPRGLLRQMERHYAEHTANVEKKFELPNWPAK